MLLNGGEFLLDLTALSLVASASSVTISNENVLSQLTDLKSYIKNQKAIKPVWIKFFDDDSDEIVVARGEIRKLLDDLEFDIFISSKGKTLTIHIEFTQKLDDNSNPIDDYYIDSGDASLVYNVVSSGTKLYRHNIVDSESGYKLVFISNSNEALNFENKTYSDFISMIEDILNEGITIIYNDTVNYGAIMCENNQNVGYILISNGDPTFADISDINLSTTTDTVTEL